MCKQVGSVLHSAPADQIADRTAIIFVELARKMNIMDADFGCNACQTKRFEKPGLNDFCRMLEPAREQPRAGLDRRSREFGQNLQYQPFDGKGGSAVLPRKFGIETIGDPGGG